jgi:O-antigen/teichoic acid export membrane protein
MKNNHPPDNLILNFLNGFVCTSLGNIVQLFLGFIGFIIAVRFIPKTALGAIVIIQLIAFLLIIISTLILEDTSVTKFITSSDQKEELAAIALTFKLILLTFFSIILFLFKPLILLFFKNEILLLSLYYYVPLLFFLGGLDSNLSRILQGYKKFSIIAISQVISGIFKLFLIWFFLMYLDLRAVGFLNALVFSYFISICVQYYFIPLKKKFILDYKKFLEMARFGFPLGINNVLNYIFTKVDRFMIGAMISSAGLASYEIATKVPEMMRRIFESFRNVYFPNISHLFSKGDFYRAQLMLNHSIRIVSFATVLLSLIVALFQVDLITLLFSSLYADSAAALSILMITVSYALVSNIIGTTLVALGQSDKPAKINVVDASFNVTLNLFLIPRFGIMGAVYATMISTFLTNPINVYFLNKTKIKVSLVNYLYPFAFYFVFFWLNRYFSIDHVILKLIVLVLFVMFSFGFSIIKISDFVLLRNFIMKRSLLAAN